MKVASINVDENIKTLKKAVENNIIPSSLHQSIKEHNEVIQILLERLSRKRPGGKSSERDSFSSENNRGKGGRGGRDQLPSQRYPNVPVIEKEISLEHPPECPCCQEKMVDSGMKESSECLTVIPKKYLIYRFFKRKYKCTSCKGSLITAKAPPRILPGSSYEDAFILDVALSKYCDLIPIERYVTMAGRNGLEGLPQQSLIGLTHHLANFLEIIYIKQGEEVKNGKVIHGDETPHRMLENNEGKKLWYLWGFSITFSCFFDIRNTRAGTVAIEFLEDSRADYLVSDVYAGYSKAVSEVNIKRKKRGASLLSLAYCNAHARRKFMEAKENFPDEIKTFLASYKEIYRLDREGHRDKMGYYFQEMKRFAQKLQDKVSLNLTLGKAISYFLKNYEGLSLCLKNPNIPLDNNHQERLLRNPVIGRKTWYGTHSKRGAKTAAVLFSIIGACHLNKINPREYFPTVVEVIHSGGDPPTPYEFKKALLQEEGPQ